MSWCTKEIDFFGIIQGVGFRPFLYTLAKEHQLLGQIQNRGDRVRFLAQGKAADVKAFLETLKERLPEHARIDHIQIREIQDGFQSEGFSYKPDLDNAKTLAGAKFHGLEIIDSVAGEHLEASIPVDLATCPDCLKEFADPENRRFLYPFISCTNCGPRYSVVTGMPYDRDKTTLQAFPLCPECLQEYRNPLDRRYHAESTACSLCGPWLEWGRVIEGERQVLHRAKTSGEIQMLLQEIQSSLAQGQILALRGMGGFQLVVNAKNQTALRRLRDRKRRPRQPFAVMARSLEVLERYCELEPATRELLASSIAPIVICDLKKDHPTLPLTDLSDGAATLGVMLPTTALHHLLFWQSSLDFLVMTSGNNHDEPLCASVDESVSGLAEIADVFLWHNREIERRIDDSIFFQDKSGQLPLLRGARGVAPQRFPVNLDPPLTDMPVTVALGGDLKNTLGLLWKDQIAVSPHLGQLHHFEAFRRFQQEIRDFPKFFAQTAKQVVVDLHPSYSSSQFGRALAEREGLKLIEVQHHHAHAAAGMFEHGLNEVLALTLDGTGYGTDGALWGGELLYVNQAGFERLARLRPSPLPGGEKAIHEPWRQAMARGYKTSPSILAQWQVLESEARVIQQMLEKNVQCPQTSSMGRLFDAFSAMLGLAPGKMTYEGEAAIHLETAATRAMHRGEELFARDLAIDSVLMGGLWQSDADRVLQHLLASCSGAEVGSHQIELAALHFHGAVIHMTVDWVRKASGVKNLKEVLLTGGVFQNRILRKGLSQALAAEGFRVYTHEKIPTGDGGISLGQLWVAVLRHAAESGGRVHA